MIFLIHVVWFLVFLKLLLFWLWLWQLKEYHFGRFFAHFETQWFKKIISSFWRPKYPKFTFKISVIFVTSVVLEIALLYYLQFYFAIFLIPFYFVIILTIILIPVVVLFFQVIAVSWRNFVISQAKKRRTEFKELLVVGITGSYGKTSTKEFLGAILETKFGEDKILKTKEHQNSEIGISQCILDELKPQHEIFIAEMGAYQKGGIKLLADIIKPKIGIVTGVNEQHLSTFGSMENLLSAEGGKELIESLPADGIAFFNAQNKYCRELYEKTNIKKFLYGQDAKNFGEENLLGAMAVAKELGSLRLRLISPAARGFASLAGMTDEEIQKAAAKIENKLPGMEIKRGIQGINIIDASYSANPTGVMAHLDYLKTCSGKKAIVMPCLIELGSASKEIHKRIGQKIAEVCYLAIITTADRFKEIKEGSKGKAQLMEDPKEIFEKIKSFTRAERRGGDEASASATCQAGDTVLLEGRVPDKLIKLLLYESS